MSVSPGTVSGKVSFCMVCIAFKALRALNHLGTKKITLTLQNQNRAVKENQKGCFPSIS